MSETKRQKFERLHDARAPKVIHAIELLENLGRSGYDVDLQRARETVTAIRSRTNAVAAAWGLEDRKSILPTAAKVTTDNDGFPGTHIERTHHGMPPAVPQRTARGGATFEAEIRWAIDALRRGDVELAENRLRRILER